MFIKDNPFIGIMALALLGAMLSKPVIAEELDSRGAFTIQTEDIATYDLVLDGEFLKGPNKFKDFLICLEICDKKFPKITDPARAACVRNCEKVLPPGK